MLLTQSVNWYWCHSTAQPKNNDDDNLGHALYLTQATVLPNSNSHPATFLPFPIHWCPPKSNTLNVDLIIFPYFIYHPLLTPLLSSWAPSGCLSDVLVPGSGRGTNLSRGHSNQNAQAGEDSCILPSPHLSCFNLASFMPQLLAPHSCLPRFMALTDFPPVTFYCSVMGPRGPHLHKCCFCYS